MFWGFMSEFKYACPVCGQHIKCDSSQSGTQMQCPTCFQKIVVPQAPSEEQKFILTGSKVGGDRPLPKNPHEGMTTHVPTKSVSGIAAVIVIFLFIAVAVAFVYHGTIFKKSTAPDDGSSSAVAASDSATPEKAPAKKQLPPMIAPLSSDTNWSLNLKGWAVPDSTAAGRIAGQDFICQRATFSGGTLTLRNGDLNVTINFGGTTPEALAGKSLNVSTNAAAAARVGFRWKVDDQAKHESFTNGYAMLLNFGEVEDHRVSGTIYLCTSDENKSYVAGKFDAEIRKSKPKN
jgi:DNA-directed RNA polymerase subunit RPC12/RpoP